MRYKSNNNSIGCVWPLLILVLLLGGFKVFFLLFSLVYIFFPLIIAGIFIFIFTNAFLRNRTIRDYVNSQTIDHKKFVELLIEILIKITKADGAIDKNEIKVIREYFQFQLNLSREELLWTKTLIKKAIKSEKTIEELCSEFKHSFSYEPSLILAGLMYKVAFADGEFSAAERNLIEKIIRFLGISEHHHRTIKSQFLKVGEEQRHYATLGLNKNANFSQIKQAYRELSRKYHPDKVSHLGEEFASIAVEKMKEINEAYDFLRKKFNT